MFVNLSDPKDRLNSGPVTYRCPGCGQERTAENMAALEMIGKAGGCQACRVMKTLEARPELTAIFVEWFDRAGWPDGMEG